MIIIFGYFDRISHLVIVFFINHKAQNRVISYFIGSECTAAIIKFLSFQNESKLSNRRIFYVLNHCLQGIYCIVGLDFKKIILAGESTDITLKSLVGYFCQRSCWDSLIWPDEFLVC